MTQPHRRAVGHTHTHGDLGEVLERRGVLGHCECGLCPVLPWLWCSMSLELLQACVRGSPSTPLLRQKSGRALLREQSSRKIFIDRKEICSPPTLWQDNSEFPEDTRLAAVGPSSSQRVRFSSAFLGWKMSWICHVTELLPFGYTLGMKSAEEITKAALMLWSLCIFPWQG